MADIVDLRSRQPTSHDDTFSAQLVTDLARYSEGLVTEKDIKRRYRFDDSVWEDLGSNESLIAAIEDEKTRRVRSGAFKKERAQAEIIDAPPILGGIMRNPDSNARHVVDSIKALDALAQPTGGEAAGAGTLFQITINLTGDSDTPHVLHFEKPIAIDPDPLNNTDDTPQDEWLPVIAATKKDNGGGPQGHL